MLWVLEIHPWNPYRGRFGEEVGESFLVSSFNLRIKKNPHFSSSIISMTVNSLIFRVISALINEIEESINRSSLLEDFKMSELPVLHDKCIELLELLVILPWKAEVNYIEPFELKIPIDLYLIVFKIQGNEMHRERVIKVLQDIFELVTSDMMTNGSRFFSSSKFLFKCFQMFSCPIFHFCWMQSTRFGLCFWANRTGLHWFF